MRIQPGSNWRWYFDAEHDRMMLDLSDDILFRSRLSSKMLTSDAYHSGVFTVEDVIFYYRFDESCRGLDLTDEQRTELVLNGLAVLRYSKPMLPKSWYFAQQQQLIQPKCGELVAVTVHVQDSAVTALMLVVDVGESASLCLLAQTKMQLAERTMLLGEPIKIMNDRLLSVSISQDNYYAKAM